MYSVSQLLSEGKTFRMLVPPIQNGPPPHHPKCYRGGLSFNLDQQFQEHTLATFLQLHDILCNVNGTYPHLSTMGRYNVLTQGEHCILVTDEQQL